MLPLPFISGTLVMPIAGGKQMEKPDQLAYFQTQTERRFNKYKDLYICDAWTARTRLLLEAWPPFALGKPRLGRTPC